MGTGTSVLTLLTLLAAGQAGGADISHINERSFKIPITLPPDARARAEIAQLHLYVSKDEGRTWQKEAAALPTQDSFEFFAQKDGPHWFNVSFTDKQKQSYPPDISAVAPALKVVIDTRKPLIKFPLTERVGDQITVAWDVREDNPDLATIKLEYRLGDSPTWLAVPAVAAGSSGSKKFSVASATTAVSVRMSVSDLAGNSGSTQHEFPAEASPVAAAPSPAAGPATSGPMLPAAPSGPAFPPPPPENPGVNPNWANKPATGPKPGDSARPTETPRGIPHGSFAAVEERPARVAIASSSTPPPPKAPIAHLHTSSQPPTGPVNPPAPKRNIQYTNLDEIDLDYEVSRVGPSGVGQVALYVTTDGGATWQEHGEDTDLASPFGLKLPSEGLFGFTLAVKSKAGLGRAVPQSGQAPDVFVELDSTPPEAVLYKVEADPRKKDTLFLTWDATDKNLTANPIRLFYATKPDGPWLPIGVDMANIGRHAWQMPADLPFRVYLRLQVRDLAGNVATADTHDPVLVDLTEPEGRISGITSKKP